MRIDKWLWAARFYKTRSRAKNAVVAGKIIVNGERCKASKDVKVGDSIDVRMKAGRIVVIVRQLNANRGSATIAQEMYEETEASKAERTRQQERDPDDLYIATAKRAKPNKAERRKLARLKQRGHL
ncbi:MAG: RNA-binding S4 domain-containing protein [Gammaproteobacteria bacterium]|nr:RNA-binding S4 domain-containing protein [Gammaproteobacteria bacterium]MDE0252496.1 RNA-binding S4 domain-containing protein [Gammaproteobacteria bacterium]MDE0403020.1 RNA-binding S4 domain-containing protein [Gammaproteobacteria bacterium]